jgi:hypothetical protein
MCLFFDDERRRNARVQNEGNSNRFGILRHEVFTSTVLVVTDTILYGSQPRDFLDRSGSTVAKYLASFDPFRKSR